MLGEIAHADIGADADRALVWGDVAGHQFQQGGLARAICPKHAPAFPSAHQEVEVGIDGLGAIALVDIAQADHVIP